MNKTWLVWAALVALFLAPAASAGGGYQLSYTIGDDYGYTTIGYDRHRYGYGYDHYRRPHRSHYYSYRPYRYYDYRPYRYSRPYRYDRYRYGGHRHGYRYRDHGRHYWRGW